MKKVLGSLLLLSLTLFAKSAYVWKVDLKERELFLHQSTVLTMQCSFSKEGKNDDIEFIPPKDIPFEFKLLNENRRFEGEQQTITYKYLIFAKEEGSYELKLQPQMLFTTQSAIDNVIEGRDNVNDLEVEKEIAQLETIKVKVKKTSSDLTGSLVLTSKLDNKNVSAFEPVHLEVMLEGEGNLHALKPIVFDIDGVQVFSDDPEKKFVLSEQGYKGTWVQRFAFVGEKKFTIPPVLLPYFDLNDKGEKVLQTQSFAVSVKEEGIKREDLIDKVDLPSEKIEWSAYLSYLYYILSFIAGFLVAKLVRLPKRRVEKEKCESIKNAKDEKELLDVLIRCEKNLFVSEIEVLEGAVYKGDKVELSTLKKRVISRL